MRGVPDIVSQRSAAPSGGCIVSITTDNRTLVTRIADRLDDLLGPQGRLRREVDSISIQK